jgi:hypothetical protein
MFEPTPSVVWEHRGFGAGTGPDLGGQCILCYAMASIRPPLAPIRPLLAPIRPLSNRPRRWGDHPGGGLPGVIRTSMGRPGEAPDCHFPLGIDGFGPIPARIL